MFIRLTKPNGDGLWIPESRVIRVLEDITIQQDGSKTTVYVIEIDPSVGIPSPIRMDSLTLIGG